MSDVPHEVRKLCSLSAPYEVLLLNEHACTITTVGLELRFQKDVSGEWEWDEIVGDCSVHVEQMSDSFYWIGFDTPEGRVCVDIGSKSRRARVAMVGWSE